jgi:hypothetical protein
MLLLDRRRYNGNSKQRLGLRFLIPVAQTRNSRETLSALRS